MKNTKTFSLVSKSGLGLLGKSTLIATGVALSSTMFSTANAANLSFSSSVSTGSNAGVDYLLKESSTDPGSIDVTVTVNDTGSGIADISGVWFHILDESLIPGLTFTEITSTGAQGRTNDFITRESTDANNADNGLGNGVNLNGTGLGNFDVGLRIGNSGGINNGDDFSSVTFNISHATQNLDLSLFSQQGFGTRLKSVGNNRNGSSKLEASAPVYTATPVTSPNPGSQPEGNWVSKTLDFDNLVNGNPLDPGTVITNQWQDSMGVSIQETSGKDLTLFNSNCDPGYSGYSGFTNSCSGGDPDLATGGSLGTQEESNVLIIQENNNNTNRAKDQDGNYITPDDDGNGGVIEFSFDDTVKLDKLGFLDFDWGELNANDYLKLIAYKADGTTVEQVFFDANTPSTSPFILANPIYADHNENNDLDNSVWEVDLAGIENVERFEVQYKGISGAISELTYQKFMAKPKVRVPEPSSIAALAFIGGGMFLSRRRKSK